MELRLRLEQTVGAWRSAKSQTPSSREIPNSKLQRGSLQKRVWEGYCGQGLKYFFEKYTVRAELVLGAPTVGEISASGSRFHGVIEAKNSYAEKLTVMFSVEVVDAQLNLIDAAAKNGVEI